MKKINSKHLAIGALILLCNFSINATTTENTPTSYVRGMMGTGAEGRVVPIVAAPFGMVQVGPDNNYFASGYHYNEKQILSFSLSHVSGNGGGDMQDICLMPVKGAQWSNRTEYPDDIRSQFSHDEELVVPGYYRVRLQDFEVDAELTATERCAVERFTYGAQEEQLLTIDMHRGNLSQATTMPELAREWVMLCELQIIDPYTVRGYRITRGWAPMQHAYFYAKFNKPMVKGTLYNNRILTADRESKGNDVRGLFEFAADGTPLEVKVGYSPVSMEGAEKNLKAEVEGKTFEEVRAATRNAWDEQLGVFQITDTDTPEKYTFYTCLYFALLYPQLYGDVDGGYRSSDFTEYYGDFRYYAGVLGLWDQYRNHMPLVSVLRPDITEDLMKTFLAHFEHCGQLPIWTINGQEDMCMTGYHAMPVIADALSKGIAKNLAKPLLDAMVTSANREVFGYFDYDFRGARNYKRYHYIPYETESHSVSKTMEYSYDDWCVAQVARMVGNKKVYKEFMERAQWYKNLYDDQCGFVRPRGKDGHWLENYAPTEGGKHYFWGNSFCEGNGWQYTFFAPQDPYGLIRLLGGREKFINKLDSLFLLGQYAHDNEPVHHDIYLYNYAGAPWRCQKEVTETMYRLYNTSPEGFCGNDDAGQMSAWYVQSAMGFFTVNHGYDVYVIGRPMFQHLSLRHARGTLTVKAPKASRENCYIQHVKVNGKPWTRNWIYGKELLNGDVVVEFTMGPQPYKAWGADIEDCPPGIDGKTPKSF